MDNKIIFNTGYTLEFRPVSRQRIAKINLSVLREFEARKEPLEVPTYYTIQPNEKDREGVKEPHNETTLETEEDKLNWAKYQDATNRLSEEQSLRTYKYVLQKGIVTDLTPSKEWIEENERLGIDTPEDEEELKLTYLYEEILASEKNVLEAVGKILALGLEGLVSNEEVKAFEDTFRGNVEPRPAKNSNSQAVTKTGDDIQE